MGIATTEEIVAELRAGRMVILVDEEDRENEGDLLMASDFVTTEAINFMVTHARGLVCLTLTEDRCEQLGLTMMAQKNGSQFGTNFTVSIEAAEGVTTGISAADRAHTIRVAVAKDAKPKDVVEPGHIFPVRAVKGGVLMRAGHTEAGCDLTAMAGLTPSATICEVLKEDGTMARLPDLLTFAEQYGLKVGTIANLIKYRNEHESIIERVSERKIQTVFGEFNAIAYRDKANKGAHIALVHGDIKADEDVLVRVHQPVTVLDILEAEATTHSWSLSAVLKLMQQKEAGVVVLLNCENSTEEFFDKWNSLNSVGEHKEKKVQALNLRTYGIGAQILKDVGVRKMKLMANQTKMPSMAGFGLEVTGYEDKPE